MQNNFYVLFLLLSVFISAVSQILLKKSALETHRAVIYEYLNAKVIIAYMLFFTAVFIDLFALRYVSISFVPVIETSSYVFVIAMSKIVFKEKISPLQISGMGLIIFGILIFIGV